MVKIQIFQITFFLDYLNGTGTFNNATLFSKYWKVINSTAYNFTIMKNGTTNSYLQMQKTSSSIGQYDDGIYNYFGDYKPKHITFEMQTDNIDIETCDLRLTSIDTNSTTFSKVQWQDVAFFRFGYFYYQKLNLVNMVQKFTNSTWYKIDLLIDWDSQAVTIYVNHVLLASDKFFTKTKINVPTANAVILYNLTPGGICKVKNLKICENRCECKYQLQ